MKVLVTGASGYIGNRLVVAARSRGYEVIAATRRPVSAAGDWIEFDLVATGAIELPAGTNAVFHLAADTTSRLVDSQTEAASARRLIAAARQVGAKFVFVSSQTALEHAPSAYGRTKWRVEQLVLAAGGTVIRPGQVYGGDERGLFGTLVRAVRVLPFIPAFLPAPQIQPIHVDDLACALLHCVESDELASAIFCVGEPEPVAFTRFLRLIAAERVGRFRLPIPVPVVLVRLLGLGIGRQLRARLGFDRLGSLFDLRAMQTEADLRRLGITLRPIVSGLNRSGNDRRRMLIGEARAFLRYVLKEWPTAALISRYVRCIERERGGQPLALSSFARCFPVTLALLDRARPNVNLAQAEFVWRLNAAVVLAEATVQGARRFLAIGESAGLVTSIVQIARALASELGWRFVRMIASPVLKSLNCDQGRPR